MKHVVFLLSLFTFISANSFAKEVSVSELTKDSKTIEFVNYRGPVPMVDSPQEVRSIGVQLAQGIGTKKFARFKYHLKYSVTHADSEKDPELLAADIFYIDRQAQVGHINYVRLMLRGFLETRYDYTSRDSRTLAIFITYYNAVHRGDLEYFKSLYKPIVLQNINANNAGISTLYNEWPGRTAMLIPLTDESQRNSINSLDTTLLTDNKVIDEMRKETDMSIDERKDMVDLQKKQINEQQKNLEKDKEKQDLQKQEIKKQEEKVQKKQEELDKKKEEVKTVTDPVEKKKKEQEIKKEEDQLNKDKKQLDNKKEDAIKKDEQIKKTEENVVNKQEDVKKQEEQIKQDEEALKKKNDPQYVAEKKEELDKKEKELAEKEKALDKKEEELKKNEDPAVFEGKFYYLRINEFLEQGIYKNDLFTINPATRKVLKKSPYETISGRKYDIFTNGVVVIGFEGVNKYNHRLILLDKDDLKPKIVCQDIVFYRSFVIIKDEEIYAILVEEDNYYLAKYDLKLKRLAKSVDKVDKDSFITFYEDYIYINNDLKNKILVLNKKDLATIDSIKP